MFHDLPGHRSWLGLLTAVGLAACPLEAQTPSPPELAAVRLAPDAPPIKVDGALTEAIWQGPGSADFRQREPNVGDPASESTEIRVAYDGTTLYVAIRARDSDPDRIISRILQRDQLMGAKRFQTGFDYGGDDMVAIQFDPFHDHRNAVIFATNPNGAEFEALLTDEGRETNVDWRGIWSVAAQRTPEGWTAEFAIPFRTLRYPTGGSGVWGFNVVRMIRRKNEETIWYGWSRDDGGFHRVSRAGHLTGLEDLPRSGGNIELKPYLLTGATREVDDAGAKENSGRLDVGVDLKWEVAPGMALDLTANTDFAQVEVDDQQVNLTRFSLFFPEKREFFLENAGIFEFGVRGTLEPPPFLMFFSRTIGVGEDGAVPIMGGARLTGRAGRQTVGFLNVVTDEATGEPRANNAVFRVKRDIGGSNYLGAMLTDRRTGEGWNTTGGVDFSAWPAATVNVQGFVAGTATDSSGPGTGAVGRLAMDWARDLTIFTLSALYVSPDATADLGFITRTDIMRFDFESRISPRPDILSLRKLDLFLFGQAVTTASGVLQDWNMNLGIGPKWGSGAGLSIYGTTGETTVDEAFDIEDRVDVPEGTYDLRQLGWFFNTSPSKSLVFRSSGLLEKTFGGRIDAMSGELTAAPSANLALALRYSHNRVDLPGGSFDANLGTARITVAASTKLVGHALVQYNDLDKTVSSNFRIAYTYRPGSDIFLVFNEERGDGVDVWAAGNRAALFKITWLWRF